MAENHEIKLENDFVFQSRTLDHGGNSSPDTESMDLDGADMAKIGKKQQLKRYLNFIRILGFSCTVMNTWLGMLVLFVIGLENGGPAGMVYGYIWSWLGYLAVVASLAELASMMPTSGGQYHWTYVLSPPSITIILSYLIGWLEFVAWQACIASASFLTGTMTQGLLVLNYPSYNFQRWHGTLLMYAAILVAILFNIFIERHTPKLLESWLIVTQIGGFILVLVPTVVLAPVYSSPKEVFATFLNMGNFSSQTLSFFVGSVASTFSFLGADGSVHMSEEIKDASINVPRSMIWSITINGTLGFAMVLATLFCIGDISSALNTPTGYPVIEIFAQALSSNAGATALTSLLILIMAIGTFTILASASRVMWAFARDNGLPFSSTLAKVNQRTKLPLISIGISAFISLLLGLINIGNTTAFNAFLSLVISCFMLTYIIPIALHLRLRIFHPKILVYGPWRLDRRLGIFTNCFAIIWALIESFFSFWPTSVPATPKTMNWSCLLFGAAVLFGAVFWLLHGRKVYKGPIVEVEGAESVLKSE